MDKIYSLGINALRKAYLRQLKLLQSGEINNFVNIGKGQDQALKGDWESEETVINYFEKERFPARIISEEHEQIDIIPNPKYLAVLDGWDGSSALRLNPQARGGTMLAIADNLEPGYEDFVFGGLTEIATKRILCGWKGNCVFLYENPSETGERLRKIRKKNRSDFGLNTKIHLDDPLLYEHVKGVTSGLDEIGELVHETFTEPLERSGFERGKNLFGLNSSASMCLDLILGEVDAVCGVIAKGVFEPPSEYVLLREIGGAMYGFTKGKWEEIGGKKWLEYGRPLSPLLRIASREIGKDLIDILRT